MGDYIGESNIQYQYQELFFFPLREPKQRGMAGVRKHQHLAKADVPACGVSVLAVF